MCTRDSNSNSDSISNSSGIGSESDKWAKYGDFYNNKSNNNIHTSIVRELHVYGSAVPLSGRDPTKFQHQGYGTLLM